MGAPTFCPLRVEGSIRHSRRGEDEAWEYAVVVTIANDRGEEKRHVVGVGAIGPGELRKFTLAVEVFTPAGTQEPNLEALVPSRSD